MKKKASVKKTAVIEEPKPEQPVVTAKDADKVELKLNGIIWNKDRPLAIINSTVVGIGSRITDRKIVAISAERVQLQYDNKKEETLQITPKISFTVAGQTPSTNPIPGAEQ